MKDDDYGLLDLNVHFDRFILQVPTRDLTTISELTLVEWRGWTVSLDSTAALAPRSTARPGKASRSLGHGPGAEGRCRCRKRETSRNGVCPCCQSGSQTLPCP